MVAVDQRRSFVFMARFSQFSGRSALAQSLMPRSIFGYDETDDLDRLHEQRGPGGVAFVAFPHDEPG
jgi:hypothetical protein